MTQCSHPLTFSKRRNRWQDKRLRQLKKLANMRAAKARKREERIAAGWRPEPKRVRAYPLELGVRNKVTGEVAWTNLRSVRDAARRLRMVLKFY